MWQYGILQKKVGGCRKKKVGANCNSPLLFLQHVNVNYAARNLFNFDLLSFSSA